MTISFVEKFLKTKYKMPISNNFSSVFSKDWEINFTQCTPNGYLKYTDLCNLLQLTAAAHSELGGISFSDMQEFNQAWVLSKMRVEVSELPKWKDTVTIKTWINSLENSRSVRALEVYVNGNKVVGSETFWAVFNTEIRRPEVLALPYKHFEIFPENNATNKSFSKIQLIEDKQEVFQKVVVLSDLDIVNHVNNVKYLEWCMDFIPSELILNQKIDSFEMNFMSELHLNDAVVIHESILDKKTILSVSKNKKNSFALEINWK